MQELPKNEKIKMIEAKLTQISRENYNLQLNLKMLQAYEKESEQINSTKIGIENRIKAFNVLMEEFNIVNV